MSIIAETLQRLQKQTPREGSDAPDSPSIVVPTRGKREPGWHTPPSRVKFWLFGIGMTIGLSGLGLFAYWIGFNLDFGMSTYASPRINQSIGLSDSSSVSEFPPIDLPPLKSVQMPSPNSVQDSPSSVAQQLGGKSSTIQEVASALILNPPNVANSLPGLSAVETSVSSEETSAQSPLRTPRKPHQRTVQKNVSITKSAKELSPKKESNEPKIVATSLPTASLPQAETPGSKGVGSDEFGEPEPHIQAEVALEEERISMEEFSSTSQQIIGDTPLPSNTTAMIPKKGEPNETGQTPVPAQVSSGNRIRQAQQLIQAGNYEEAVSILSPLFKNPPVNWEPWFWMGTALLGQNELEEADQFFLSGLARNDKIPQLWIQRALVAHQRGEYQLAIHELRRAESLDAALPHTHLNMGFAYEKLGNDRLANEYYAKFMKLSEGNPAFFSIRKKLFARFTEQVHSTPHPGLPSSLSEDSQHTSELSRP